MTGALWRPKLREWPDGWRPTTVEEERLWTEQVKGLLSPVHPLVGREFKVIGCLTGQAIWSGF